MTPTERTYALTALATTFIAGLAMGIVISSHPVAPHLGAVLVGYVQPVERL